MKSAFTIAAFAATLVGAAMCWSADDTPAAGPAALERKLEGAWQGGPCDGGLVIRADGTYERTHWSPADKTLAGHWTMRWDALPPTLILKCESSSHLADVGTLQELSVVKLNDSILSIEAAGQKAREYSRDAADKAPVPAH